jgi:hypothetical protein
MTIVDKARSFESGEMHDREGDRTCIHKELGVRVTDSKVVQPKKALFRVIVT